LGNTVGITPGFFQFPAGVANNNIVRAPVKFPLNSIDRSLIMGHPNIDGKNRHSFHSFGDKPTGNRARLVAIFIKHGLNLSSCFRSNPVFIVQHP
jgi:hypothetical protein